MAYCQFTAFPLTEEQKSYYLLGEGEDALFRHPFIDTFTGEPGKILEYAVLAGTDDQLIDLAYQMAVLNSLQSAEEIEAFITALPDDISSVWSLRGEDHQLFVRGKDASRVTLRPDSGYDLTPIQGGPQAVLP